MMILDDFILSFIITEFYLQIKGKDIDSYPLSLHNVTVSDSVSVLNSQ